MESNANIKQLFASKLSNFSYNHKENLFRQENALSHFILNYFRDF